jgi:hypothetical protein
MMQVLREYWRERKRSDGLRARFTLVHDHNLWGADESRSGWGSCRGAQSVAVAKAALRKAVTEHGVRSIHDIPCGDFNWMPDVLAEFGDVGYIGFDIVRAALHRNRDRRPDVEFRWLDITAKAPPAADLIFCKDLLNHLSDADVRRAIANMRRSGSTYLLASNNSGYENSALPDHPAGSRHLDVTAPPFCFRAPLWTLGEYMSFWRLADIGEGGV